jgi:hypothetical protein
MQYKLGIGDFIGVQVEGEANDAQGAFKPFSFVLVCKRLTADQLSQRHEKGEETFLQLFTEIATDWRNQALVLNEDGTPAAFSAEALAVLFSIPGMPLQVYTAYLQQVAVRQKNSLKPRA